MEFFQIDVFASGPYRGNPLAVFPDASSLDDDQMQSIAREMKLSETTFVTGIEGDTYDVRIFTPGEELPFAGHPTIGTAWVLSRKGLLSGTKIIQRSKAGDTPVAISSDGASFERTGGSDPDLADKDADSTAVIAKALALDTEQVGLDAAQLGREGRLLPAASDAGVPVFVVPVRDREALRSIELRIDLFRAIDEAGAYCFTATEKGLIEARGLFPGLGVPEDPATGAGGAATGLYLADRLGDIDVTIEQGLQVQRPSVIEVSASPGRVRVSGSCHFVFSGTLEALP